MQLCCVWHESRRDSPTVKRFGDDWVSSSVTRIDAGNDSGTFMASFRRVSIDTVPVGAILKAPITDPDHAQIKLLSEGIEVTAAFLDRLRARGITEVVIGTP